MAAPPGLVILDRDGVLNVDRPEYVLRPAEWIPIPGSLEAVARLTRAGHRVVVATNQSAVGRGLLAENVLEAIHDRMREEIAAHGGRIEAVYVCPHAPDEGCPCRKPAPGLYRRALDAFPDVPLRAVRVVGDSLRDLLPAWELGVSAHLVRTGKGEATLQALGPGERSRARVHDDLSAFVRDLLDP